MKNTRLVILICLSCILFGTFNTVAQTKTSEQLKQAFLHPPEDAKPWVFWYWMYGAVTKEGITADLQATKNAGIEGLYLMPIKGPGNPPLISPPATQLTPHFWELVKFAMSEADRIGVKLAFHDCDGFAVSGGPWITPEMSMQKVVWSKTLVSGGKMFHDTLAKPQSYKGYYRDIKIFAYPLPEGSGITSQTIVPKITAST